MPTAARCSWCCWWASVLLVGALTYVPALALGPVAEQLQHIPAAVRRWPSNRGKIVCSKTLR